MATAVTELFLWNRAGVEVNKERTQSQYKHTNVHHKEKKLMNDTLSMHLADFKTLC